MPRGAAEVAQPVEALVLRRSGTQIHLNCYRPVEEGMTKAAVFLLSADEMRIVDALKKKDEAVFLRLIDGYRDAMLQIALAYTSSRAVAEEILQDTWLALLGGLDRFDGRSSLKACVFGILIDIARRRGEPESRTKSLSSPRPSGKPEAVVDPQRFQDSSGLYPGGWKSFPESWAAIPEARLHSKDVLEQVRSALDALPAGQRQVIALRDISGMTAAEACNVLGISETNERLLLHRARSRVRSVMERYLGRPE